MIDVARSVTERYTEGATERQEALCCPVDYDDGLLKMLPQEIIERDYGCGDPSRYVKAGDTVLDLGSGGGKICYMAAQLVGENGRVIGVDMNVEMLDLARRHQTDMANKLGGDRVRFLKGYIQDLALDLDETERWLAEHPVTDAASLSALHDHQAVQRHEQPLITDASVDLVVSNCVLNLVREADRRHMIAEIFRVLKPGGRVAISDIVSDKFVPVHLKQNSELWSGCVSGAFQEAEFLQVFLDAGFVATRYDKWDTQPWQTVENIEFRSVTLTAVKPEDGAGVDAGQALIYRGPYACVQDDMGTLWPRGERLDVSDVVFKNIMTGPLAADFIAVQPGEPPQADCDPGSSCC